MADLRRTKVVNGWTQSGRNILERARKKLEPDDELFAWMLCLLADKCYRVADSDPASREMRIIGQRLYDNGGKPRMQLVCCRVGVLGGESRTVECAWDGIGDWRC